MGKDWLFIAAVLGTVLVGIWLLLLALGVLVQAVVVAFNLFAWAAQHGFVGIACTSSYGLSRPRS